jgi:hypothetical protein
MTTTRLKTQHNGTWHYDAQKYDTQHYRHTKMILNIYKMSLRNVTLSITTTSLKTQYSNNQHCDAQNDDTQHTSTQK